MRGGRERTVASALVFLALFLTAAGFWFALLPLAHGRDLTPVEMIQAGLPFRQTIQTAQTADLLFAVCRAVGKYPTAAASIVSTAVADRKELAPQIVVTALRCGVKKDCDFAGAMVAAAVTAAPDSAANIGQAASARAPNCAEIIQRAIEPATPADGAPIPNGQSGTSPTPGEEYDPLEPLHLVCDQGTPRALRASELDEFLKAHPGATLGPCPPSPSPTPGPK